MVGPGDDSRSPTGSPTRRTGTVLRLVAYCSAVRVIPVRFVRDEMCPDEEEKAQ